VNAIAQKSAGGHHPGEIRSMTGFGRAQGQFDSLGIEVELTSLNRKHFEVQTSLPKEWAALEVDILGALRQSVSRGRVQVSIRATMQAEAETNPIPAWLKGRMERLRQWCEALGIAFAPDARLLAEWMREEMEDPGLPPMEACRKPILELVEEANVALTGMRLSEGRRLVADLKTRLQDLRETVDAIESEGKGSVPDYRDALQGRLAELDLAIDANDERLLKELAIFADRVDVSEELTRIAGHFAQFEEILEAGGAVGRKLEFLLQEMQRELNTLGAKSYRVGAKKLGLEARSILEQIREQVVNLE